MSFTKNILSLGFILSLACESACLAATPVVRINWKDRPLPAGASVVANDLTEPAPVLKVSNPSEVPLEVTLYTVDATCLNDVHFFVSGRVRWENSAGQAELILATEYADGYVNRNAQNRVEGSSIKSKLLIGTGDWSNYELGSCNCRNGEALLKTFSLILRMPASGTFYFGASQVYEGKLWEFFRAQPGEWWGRGFVALPVILPVIIANLLMQYLVKKRGFTPGVYMYLGAVLLIGLIGLIAGIAALLADQRFYVYMPCFEVGILAVNGIFISPGVRQRMLAKHESATETPQAATLNPTLSV